ncbi:hypothetical protein XF_2188 [Xylella fastidiosa 9a5c]|uniref:Uncharacterized protein n=1 Tax=Xylella fastidiosa (strain 9a5c) TaxID=160492 RepID=Q9PBF6_XYLFA|nr:hypothetical protein XF_2188 [Xylella fastidiosa 9a5c]
MKASYTLPEKTSHFQKMSLPALITLYSKHRFLKFDSLEQQNTHRDLLKVNAFLMGNIPTNVFRAAPVHQKKSPK